MKTVLRFTTALMVGCSLFSSFLQLEHFVLGYFGANRKVTVNDVDSIIVMTKNTTRTDGIPGNDGNGNGGAGTGAGAGAATITAAPTDPMIVSPVLRLSLSAAAKMTANDDSTTATTTARGAPTSYNSNDLPSTHDASITIPTTEPKQELVDNPEPQKSQPPQIQSQIHSQSQSRRLCSREEIRHGQWLPVMLDKPPFVPSHSKCYSRQHLLEATNWTDYQWHPFNSTAYAQRNGLRSMSPTTDDEYCEFEQFSIPEFCRLVHNKTIAFVGDSLTWEQFSSLAARFKIQVGAHDQLIFRADNGQVHNQNEGMIFDVCGDGHNTTTSNNGSRIAFFRNRYLMYVDDFLNRTNADVMVLNFGAHRMADSHMIDGFPNRPDTTGVKWLLQKLDQHQERKRQQQLDERHDFLAVWRTTSPGHYNCWNFTEPVNNITFMEEYIEYSDEKYPGRLKGYGWYDFQRQNKLIVQEFNNYNKDKDKDDDEDKDNNAATTTNQNETKLNFEIMHGYDVIVLRPDAHVGSKRGEGDCLHFCDPGPADVYNTLLLHLLRLQEQEQQYVAAWH